MIKLQDVSYVRLGTADLEGATAFATEYLGLEIAYQSKDSVYLKSDQREHTLCYFAGAPTDQTAAFEVADTGIGMTPEQVARLFQPFVQAEAGTARRYGGTGLGLALSQRFCRLLGGEITVTSAAGAGSVFAFDLPLVLAAAPSGEVEA